MFQDCTSLTQVSFAPKSELSRVGYMAFVGTGLSELAFPPGARPESGAFLVAIGVTGK